MISSNSLLAKSSHRIFRVVCCFLFLFVFVPNCAVWAIVGAQLFEEHKAAVVKLEITGWLSNGKRLTPLRPGTGFIIYSGKPHTVILTAAHVIGPRSEWEQKDGKAQREVRVKSLDDHGKLVLLADNARVHEQNDAQDWAILLIDGEGYSCLEPGDPLSVAPGDFGALIGYEADSKVPGYADGKVTKTSVEVERYGFVLRLNMDVIEGQSGAPILDTHGRVLGIASGNERDKLGYHIGVPVSLPAASFQSLIPPGGTGNCISAERQYDSYIKAAEAYRRLGKQKEYVEALENLLSNKAVLQRLPDAKKFKAEKELRFNIGMALMSEDYIEGISAPKQSAMSHLEQARLLDPTDPLVLIILGFSRASEAAERLPDPKSKAPEIRNIFADAFKYIEEGRSNGHLNEDHYYMIMSLYHYWCGRALMQLKEHADAKNELTAGLDIAKHHLDLPNMAEQKNQFLYRLGQNEIIQSRDVSLAAPYWVQVSDNHYVSHALALSGIGLWYEGITAQHSGSEEKADEKFRLAEKALSTAKQLGERSFRLSLILGMMYFNRENYIDAAANFQDATNLNSSKAIPFYMLGRSKFMIGDKESLVEGRKAMQRAVELDPNDSSTHYWNGRILAASGQNDTAIKEFKRSIEIDPKNTKVYPPLVIFTMLAAEEKDADPHQKVSTYEKALRLANDGLSIANSEKDAETLKRIKELQHKLWNALAYAYAEQGEYMPIAEGYIDRALSANPNDPNYLDTKAWVWIRSSELSKNLSNDQREDKLRRAEQLLKKALDSMPQDASNAKAEVVFHLGYVERLRGNNEAAQIRFLEALDLNPEYQNAKEALKK
jgi:tetratricopeptide (TPR) repeat protein